MEAEQRRLREVEEELGNGLIQLREKLHKQEVKKQLRENFTKTHISRCLQWRKKFSKQRKSWRWKHIIDMNTCFEKMKVKRISFVLWHSYIYVKEGRMLLIHNIFSNSETCPRQRGGEQKEDWEWGFSFFQFLVQLFVAGGITGDKSCRCGGRGIYLFIIVQFSDCLILVVSIWSK